MIWGAYAMNPSFEENGNWANIPGECSFIQIQVESVGTRARLLATGTRGSSSRGHLTPVSVLLCLCPRRLASKTHVVSGLADSEHPFSCECRFSPAHRKRIIHDVFSMVWNPRRNIGFYPIILEDRPCLVKMKKGYNAACMFCILREYHTAGIVFPSLKMCVIWFIKRVARL